MSALVATAFAADPIVDALAAELERSASIALPDAPPPYFEVRVMTGRPDQPVRIRVAKQIVGSDVVEGADESFGESVHRVAVRAVAEGHLVRDIEDAITRSGH